MKEEDVMFISNLDPDRMDGTIQDVLMNTLNAPLLWNLKKLCVTLKNDKDALQKENKKLSSILKDNNLYTAALVLGDNE